MNDTKNDVMTPSVKAKITWINANAADARKATASVTIGGAFQVHGISVFQGKNGTFLSMPQRQVTDMLGKNPVGLFNMRNDFFVQFRIVAAASDGAGEIDFLVHIATFTRKRPKPQALRPFDSLD